MKNRIKPSILVMLISLLSLSTFATNIIVLDSMTNLEIAEETPVLLMETPADFDTDDLLEEINQSIGIGVKKVAKSPPKVNFYEPLAKRFVTTDDCERIFAKVEGVYKKKQITMKVNGKRTRKFKFKKKKGIIKTKYNWNAGENLVEFIVKNELGIDNKFMTMVYHDPANRPTVELTNPSSNYMTTTNETKLVTAKLHGVYDENTINVLVNGIEQDFTFHPSSGILRTTIDLDFGKNELYVEGHNEFGQKGFDETVISRREKGGVVMTSMNTTVCTAAPIVKITAPCPSPFYSNQGNIAIKADIDNIDDKNQVEFTFNGMACADFSYNDFDEAFIAYVNLRQGSNVFTIRAVNANGADVKTGTIIYKDNYQQRRPQVDITKPYDNITVRNGQVNLEALTRNIDYRNQVTLRVNGSVYNNFDFNYGNVILSDVNCLRRGRNVIEVTVSNNVGQATDQVIVNYERLAARPSVAFTSPTTNGGTATSASNTLYIKATVRNANRNQVQLTVNNQTHNFTLVGTQLSAQVPAKEGRNTVKITARNQGQVASEYINVMIKKPVRKPIVTIQKPSNRITVTKQQYGVQATVKHVTNKNSITVLVNNQRIYNFAFNTSTGRLTFDSTLKEGSNLIKITARNKGGVATKTAMIHRKEVMKVDRDVVMQKEAKSKY